MAEAVGLAASIITLIGVVGEIGSTASTIVHLYKSGPASAQNALEELRTLEAILKQLVPIVASQNFDSPQLRAVQLLFSDPIAKCTDTCIALSKLLKKSDLSTSLKARAKWIHLQKEVGRLVSSLSEQKLSFNLLFALLSSNQNIAVLNSIKRIETDIITQVQLEQTVHQSSVHTQHAIEGYIGQAVDSLRREIVRVPSPTTCLSQPRIPTAQNSGSRYLVKEAYMYVAEKVYHFPAPQYNWHSQRRQRKIEWAPQSTPQLLMGRWVLKVCSIDNASADRPHMKGFGFQLTYLFPLWMFLRFAILYSFFVEYDARKRQFSIQRSIAFPSIVDPGSDVMLFAKHGNVEGLKMLFSTGRARPTDADITGITPLHWAARRVFKSGDSFEIIELLLNEGADINATGDREADTPLHWVATYAASKTSRQVMKFLKDMGADATLPDVMGSSADDIFESLYGVTGQFEKQNDLGITPLMKEVGKGDECSLTKLNELVAEEGLLEQDRGGWTAMHWAAMGGSSTVIQNLIKAGIKMGFNYAAGSRFGAKPRDVAARYGNEEAWKIALTVCGLDLSVEL
ncbi:hypothetical protein H072_18 [Dactylellina haptotyla CBS 200.50]|uniref:Azaphilone pigments biosynthesis cluster protein L N-terminal domain-containing protein n=1 Tax=Dactylellina haptotyla (strain CBS 200.50) TaxID=1284197 RepID=S8C2S2_DACHA|nr:hypothetical protein H072_18 [Dactylellina haptotyla CBS 200.50]